MSAPRLIASDLDGTLLDDRGELSTTTIRAVAACAEADVPFVVVTGRPARWLGPIHALAGCHPFAVVSNGAAVLELDSGDLLDAQGIDPGTAREVADQLRHAFPELRFGVERGRHYGCEPGAPGAEEAAQWRTVAPLDALLSSSEPLLKLLAFHPRLSSVELAGLTRSMVGERLTVTHSQASGPGLLEISAPGVTKGAALERLCRQLGVPLSEVAAFGDMPNDIPMLDVVGRPHVVANGHPDLLDRGYPVVGPNYASGVALAILTLLAEGTSSR